MLDVSSRSGRQLKNIKIITEWGFRLEGTSKITSFQSPWHGQGRLPLDQIAWSSIQFGLEHSQGIFIGVGPCESRKCECNMEGILDVFNKGQCWWKRRQAKQSKIWTEPTPTVRYHALNTICDQTATALSSVYNGCFNQTQNMESQSYTENTRDKLAVSTLSALCCTRIFTSIPVTL